MNSELIQGYYEYLQSILPMQIHIDVYYAHVLVSNDWSVISEDDMTILSTWVSHYPGTFIIEDTNQVTRCECEVSGMVSECSLVTYVAAI